MDEKRYNEINTAVQKIANGYTAYNAVNPYYGAKSGMDVDETYGFLNKQAAYDADWKIAKGFYNGLVANTGRGIMGALALVRDMNIDSLKERGLAYNENTAFEDVANSDVLTPYDVKGRNELEQLGIDIASGAGQLAGQAATTALTGGTGSMVAMGTQIAGNQYLDLRQQGVSAENARWPSITNALMQAPLERFGLEGILAKLPAKSVLREKAKRIAQAAITEGVTEWMQQYPEEITNLYALQPGDRNDPEQRRKAWFAAGDEFIRNFGDITREGAYAGLIGGMLGGFGGGVNVMFRSVDRQIRKQVHNELLQDTAKRIDNVKKSGISPDYARNVINANNPGDKIYVDGETMHQYMQGGNATEIAKNIGVTEDEVQKAAESGTDVAINRGDFEAAAAKMPDFFESVQNGVAFEEGGYTLTKAQLEEEQQKLLREVQREDPLFTQQLDSLRMQLRNASVNKRELDSIMVMLESRARVAYPEEPSRFFIEHPLEIQRIVRPQNGQKYFQTASANERLLQDEQNFAKTVDDYVAGKLNESSVYNVMTTPLALKVAGARLLPLKIDGSKFEHILKYHADGMTPELLKQVPRALADPMMILNSYAGRKVVVLDLKDTNGATVIVPVELDQKRQSQQYEVNILNNAYGKGDENGTNYNWFIEHNMKKGRVVYINRKKTAEWLQSNSSDSAIEGDLLGNLSNNIIPNEDDLRNEREANEGYYQTAYHGTPYSFEKFDLGAIGSGEGAQVHGWGLYFAKNRRIANKYKEVLGITHGIVQAGDITYTVNEDGEWLNTQTEEEVVYGTPLSYALTEYETAGSKHKAIENLKKDIAERQATDTDAAKKFVTAANEAIKILENNDFKVHNTPTVIEVDVPENKVLLDEQKPFKAQLKNVQKLITKAIQELPELQQLRFWESLIQRQLGDSDKTIKSRSELNNKKSLITSLQNLNDKNRPAHLKRATLYNLKSDGYTDEQINELQKDNQKLEREIEKYNAEIPALEEALNAAQEEDVKRNKEKIKQASANPAEALQSNLDTGEKIYQAFAYAVGGGEYNYRKASEYLNSQGIKGITYDGQQDGRCFVVFDDKAISIINRYNQSVGIHARTANRELLNEAQAMAAEGKMQREIYEKTGWRRGADGKWRFEIPDNLDKIDIKKLQGTKRYFELGEIYDNEKLYEAYPFLRELPVMKEKLDGNQLGYSEGHDLIVIDEDVDEWFTPGTIIHELQHIIQAYEGFASGGNPQQVRTLVNEAVRQKTEEARSLAPHATTYYNRRREYEMAAIMGDEARMKELEGPIKKLEQEIPNKARRDRIYKLFSEADSLLRKANNTNDKQLYRNLYGEKEARAAEEKAKISTEIERARQKGNAKYDEILNNYTERLPEELQPVAKEYVDLIKRPLAERDFDRETEIEEQLLDNEVASEFYNEISDSQWEAAGTEELQKEYTENVFEPERGDAVVIFNDNLVASHSEADQEAKGSITWDQEGNYIIQLFQGADASTLIHETGHYFVDTLARDVNNGRATEQQQRDWQILLNYAGITNEQWLTMNTKQKTPAHEKFARAFEQYLMEGKAPSRELRGVFRRFKNWLLNIYKSVENFLKNEPDAAPLNDDVRQVFGRMLAAEEDVRAAQKIDGYFNDLPAVVLDSLPESWQKRVDDFANRAREKAIDILTQKSLANFTQDRKERIAAYRSEILPQAEADVNKMPLYNAADDIETYIGDGTRTAKSTARKYLNAEGKVYANWREEWEAVRADIDERLNPIIDQLKAGMNQGVSRRRDEVTGRWLRESNNDMWYREWWRVHKRQPTAKELRDMAYEIYVGDMNMPGWINDSAEAAEYYAQNKAEIDELLAREEDLIQYKDDVAKYRHRGLTESDRMTFDMLAEQYGYTCGDELAQKIINSPTKQAAITARADEYVQQAFPDIYKERELAADTVRESLYNDESGAVIGLEQQLIQDYISEAQIKNRSAEANRRIAAARRQQAIVAAQTEINKMPVEDAVRTSRFISAERLAAQKSAEAMALGAAAQKKANEATNDAARSEAQTNANTFFRQALRYKNQQAFNHAMARESMKMRTAVTKYRNYINRQFTASRKTWVSDEHFSQAAAILARMGFVRKDYDPYLKKQKLADYNAEMQELYGTGAIASWIMDENISLRNPMQLTFSQFEDIAEALQNIKANAKAQEGNGTLGQNVPFSDLLNDIMRHLDKLDTKFLPAAGKRQQATPLARMIASARNIDNLFEWMDKWSYGFFSKVFGEQIKHCNDHEAELTMAWKNRVTAAQKEWLPDAAAKREADRRFYSDELGCDVDKHVLVRLLMNLGNEGNARVLCSRPPNAMAGSKLWVYPEGNITYEQAVMETKANLLTYLGENLTVADIQYAQDMIDAANMYWEEFSALEKRTKGFAPKKVEALPVEITLADGTSVVFKGGYFPLIRDGEFGSKPQGQDVIVSDTEPNQGRNIRTLATGNGNLKERVNASYPIDLTRGAEFYVMQNGIHDLCWRETLTGFRRILNDESMYTMLKEKLGPAQMRVFREMLEKAAQPFKMPGTSEGENLLNDAAGWLRRKTVAVAIMGNIKTMLQNGGNLLLYGRSVEGFGYADTLAAMANWGKNWQSGDGEKGLRAFVTSKSVFMRERTENPDITLREIKDEDNLNPIEKKAMDWGGKAMAYTDNFTAMPVWAQAYMKKINAGATEQEAVDFADAVIRRTLGSSRLTDVSSLQRGGNLAKLFMMFQGFFNTQYNQWERQYGMFRNKWKKGDWQSRFEAAQNICAFAAGKWFAVCLVNLLLAAENPFDDDDDEYMKITKELFHYPIILLGPVGTAGNAVLDNAMGFSGYGYRMTAAESAINSVIRTAGKVNKVATDEDSELTDLIEPAATLGGYVVGAPGIVNKLFFNAWDILYNDMEPQVGDLFKRRPERER